MSLLTRRAPGRSTSALWGPGWRWTHCLRTRLRTHAALLLDRRAAASARARTRVVHFLAPVVPDTPARPDGGLTDLDELFETKRPECDSAEYPPLRGASQRPLTALRAVFLLDLPLLRLAMLPSSHLVGSVPCITGGRSVIRRYQELDDLYVVATDVDTSRVLDGASE